MATGSERSKPLHNFTLPCDLRWGNQRFLRCMKVKASGRIPSSHLIEQRRTTRDPQKERDSNSSFLFADGSPRASRTPSPPAATPFGGLRFEYKDEGGIAATREKVMLDLQTAADKMKNAFFKDGGLVEGDVSLSRQPPIPPPPPSAAAAPSEVEIHGPWNLRTRRASCRTPESGVAGGGSSGAGVKGLRLDSLRPKPGSSQMRSPAAAVSQKSPIHRSNGGEAAANGEKEERATFSVALSKRVIEEDFFSIVGHRPPRRPKKRPRTVQKQLDALFPGLWLTEVTRNMYKVSETAPQQKIKKRCKFLW